MNGNELGPTGPTGLRPIWICCGCGLREPAEPDQALTPEPPRRPCPQGIDRCDGTLGLFAKDPKASSDGRRNRRPVFALAAMALAMTATMGLSEPPNPHACPACGGDKRYQGPRRGCRCGLPKEPPRAALVVETPELLPSPRATFRTTHPDAGSVIVSPWPSPKPVAPPKEGSCPDLCGLACRFHGKRHAKLARRAARAAK
jgi:hypothetical protein